MKTDNIFYFFHNSKIIQKEEKYEDISFDDLIVDHLLLSVKP
jgi:hypothetical protein